MPHYIKTGFWVLAKRRLEGWLDLDALILQIAGGGGGGGTWGSITGSLSNQTDLETALNGKEDSLGYTPENSANKVGTIAASSTQYPSSNAVMAYAQASTNAAVALVDAATMDLTATKHTLASSAIARTFTISYAGDDIVIEVTLNTTTTTYTFPATALCVSEGTASGNNTAVLNGVSGDKYIIAIKKIGSAYYVVIKNFGQ